MDTPPKWLTTGYALLFALLPWSVDLGFGTWNLMLPSEPLIGALGLGLAWLFWQNPPLLRGIFSKNIFLQLSLAYIAWMAVSACFSSLPLVSWKFWLVEAAHWWVFAVGISAWPGLWRRAFAWFAFSMAGVVVYTLAHHAQYGFRADQTLLAPMPFFPENTMWAAAVVMVLFFSLPFWKPMTRLLFLLLLAALVFSSCRAAWVSALIAAAVFLWVKYVKGRVWKSAVLLLVLLAGGIFFGGKIAQSLAQDVSAQERINRWKCGFRMAQGKPLAGFGPGTFQFQYLGFQKPEEMTRISLREPIAERGLHTYGRGGGAHSEYLRALAEMGWLGFLLWAGLVAWALWAGFSRVPELSESLLPTLALLTFFAHSVVNDFLHDGRMAALVWGGMAVLFAERQK